jgi:ComF family protein
MERTAVTSAFREAVRFLFPNICMICGRVLVEGRNCGHTTGKLQICTSCLSTFPVRSSSERWFPCLSHPSEQDPAPDLSVWALFHYDAPVTMLLRSMKFNSKIYCGTLIGELIGREFPMDFPFEWDAVIPIPLSEKRLEKRGFNQAEILAGGLAKHLNIPICNNVIRRTRNTHQQSRFTKPAERAANVKGAFAMGEEWDITGWNILLVDDILTTGSTMHEAARILLENGACRVFGVVAATHRENVES